MMKPDMNDRFPIRVLAESTGVGASTLRAWERRYGLLKPERTPKGHRLYRPEDFERIGRILALLQEGHALPSIAERLHSSGSGPSCTTSDEGGLQGIWHDYVSRALLAIEEFSTERLDTIHNEASSLYPVDLVTEQLIVPVLADLGRRWQARETGIGEEHFYACWVRNRLGARFHHALGQAGGTRILCACLPDEHHELGLMLFSLSALARGYRVLYLGSDLPLDQILPVAKRSGSRAVVLSARTPPDATLQGELARLAGELHVPLLFGGLAADRPLAAFEEAGGIRLGSRIAIALKVLGTHLQAHGQEKRTRAGQRSDR
jgi:DNA-binding transcriptional MerR regulator